MCAYVCMLAYLHEFVCTCVSVCVKVCIYVRMHAGWHEHACSCTSERNGECESLCMRPYKQGRINLV